MITKKKKNFTNLTKKKKIFVGGSNHNLKKPSNSKDIQSWFSYINSLAEKGGYDKEPQSLNKKKSTERSPRFISSVNSNDELQIEFENLVKMFLNPNTYYNQKNLTKCLNFNQSIGAIGKEIGDYKIPSNTMSNKIYTGYFVNVNETSETVGSIYLIIEKHKEKKKSSRKKKALSLETDNIHYIDEMVADIIINNNPELIIPEFSITNDDHTALINRNLGNSKRKTIIQHIDNESIVKKKKQIKVEDIRSYCLTNKFSEINIYEYMAQCNISTSANQDYPTLSSFGFDTLDELKIAFKTYLKTKTQLQPETHIISLLALRYAAVCNVIVKDILKKDYFVLYDFFTIEKDDEIVMDSFMLNTMGSFCLDIFNSNNLDLSIIVQEGNNVIIKPFRNKDIIFNILFKYSINTPEIEIITSVINSFFNLDGGHLLIVDMYLKLMNQPERSKVYLDTYGGILNQLKKSVNIENITKLIKPIKSSSPRLALFPKHSIKKINELDQFKETFSYFIEILERMFNNARKRGLIHEHFYKKIIKLSNQLGYYSILTESIIEPITN